MQQLPPNTFLQGGKYQIEKTLGQGSFGITYLARHTNLGKKLAIKEFFMRDLNSRGEDGSITGMSDSSLSYNYCQKFKKEAINLSNLEHPNIVKVTDSFAENGTFYYVMDYIDGQNLNDYIKTHNIGEAEAVDIIKCVADALIYMHETHRMLHLDMKPGNIMRRDSDGHIFLIDFGLSKHFDKNGEPESSTNIGLGTAGYAPIEQGDSTKSGEFRPTIDVYALGATLYKLLTGETPPNASTLVSDSRLIENNLRRKGVSTYLIDAIVAAMKPSVYERTQTIRAFKEMLSCKTDDEATLVKPVGVADVVTSTSKSKNEGKEHSTKDWKSHKMLYALAAVVVALCALGIWALTSNSEEQEGPCMTFTVNGVSFDMVRVEAGTFTMGATAEDPDAYDGEKPAHPVTITKDYYLGKTEVTQALWKAIMGSNPSHFNGDDLPVEQVSWDDCQEFIKKLNSLTGKTFRLPTEAEWEFAARGGNNSRHYKYSGSDNLHEVGWYTDNSSNTTHDVATKQPNELGIYDMSGNVWEWCQDRYGAYSSNAQYDPAGPTWGSDRVCRGGGWLNVARYCRSSYRYLSNPGGRAYGLGFRLCLSSETNTSTSNPQTRQASSPVKEQTSTQINNPHSNGVLTFAANGVSFDMIKVEAGTFTMGATAEQGDDVDDDEKAPQVTITKDYYMGKTEVTQALWTAVMGSNPSHFKGDNKPVETVSWDDCQDFISKLNRLTGKTFRLPTEAEWEFAARGGNKSQHNKYSGSNDLNAVGWFEDNSSNTTHDVATKQPNELGIYDMTGNVWEWCQDWKDYYSSNAQYDPTGPTSGSFRVDRGGSWRFNAWFCYYLYRSCSVPDNRDYDIGFRLCLSE